MNFFPVKQFATREVSKLLLYYVRTYLCNLVFINHSWWCLCCCSLRQVWIDQRRVCEDMAEVCQVWTIDCSWWKLLSCWLDGIILLVWLNLIQNQSVVYWCYTLHSLAIMRGKLQFYKIICLDLRLQTQRWSTRPSFPYSWWAKVLLRQSIWSHAIFISRKGTSFNMWLYI